MVFFTTHICKKQKQTGQTYSHFFEIQQMNLKKSISDAISLTDISDNVRLSSRNQNVT